MPSVKRPARNSSRTVSVTAAQNSSPQRAWMSRSPITAIVWLSGATKRRTPLRSSVFVIPSRTNTTAASAWGSMTSRSAHVHADLAARAGLRLADRRHDPLVVE